MQKIVPKAVRQVDAIALLVGLAMSGAAACLAAEPPRTLALVDFSVGAPAGKASESAWLGPAVAELLQAKMQLFEGARVVERSRVRPRLATAGRPQAPAEGALPEYGAILAADILIAGSVEVAAGEGPPRIKVRARAFETGTAKIISEAAFEGTAELSGLRQVSEDLARTLAERLKLSYTPEQAVYAEPSGIDSLKHFIAGSDHFIAGRLRETVDALQLALEGNAGRYFAAAHRLQGEAFQSLALAQTGAGRQKVVDEYLAKFREDARLASVALFDLGLAYEANGLWREAAGAFGDYVAAQGQAEPVVLWTYGRRVYGTLEGGKRVHIFPNEPRPLTSWIVLDAENGVVIRDVPLEQSAEEGYHYRTVFGLSAEGIYLHEQRSMTVRVGGRPVGTDKTPSPQRLVAVGPDGRVVWRRDVVSGYGMAYGMRCAGGRIILSTLERTAEEAENPYSAGGGSRGLKYVLTLDAGSGTVLSKIPYQLGDDLAGLDHVRATLLLRDSIIDLATGTRKPVRGAPGDPAERSLSSWRKGVTYLEEPQGIRLFEDGRERLFLEGCTFTRQRDGAEGIGRKHAVQSRQEGPLLFHKGKGFVRVDPAAWTVTELYADYTGSARPEFIDGNASFLLFALGLMPDQELFDLKYGLAVSRTVYVLNLFDAASGRLLAKTVRSEYGSAGALLGGDVLRLYGAIERWRFPAQDRSDTVPVAEAHLHAARCLQRLGDDGTALEQLKRFDALRPGDLRAQLLRVRMAIRAGDKEGAFRQAVSAITSGGVTAEELQELLPAVQAVYPEVKGALRAAVNGRLCFESVIAPGTIVALHQSGSGDTPVFCLLDTNSGTSRVVPAWQLDSNIDDAAYRGRFAYGGTILCDGRPLAEATRAQLALSEWQVVFERVDLTTGEWVKGQPLPGGTAAFVPGAGLLALVYHGPLGTGDLVVLDPEDLSVVSRTELGPVDRHPFFVGNGLAVLVQPASRDPDVKLAQGEWSAAVAVVDTADGRLILSTSVPLDREEIVAAAADRTTLVLGIRGSDPDAWDQGGRDSWYRIEAIPLGPGGQRWTRVADGYLAGNLLLSDGGVTYPAHEGKLPWQVQEQDGKTFRLFAPRSLPLRAVTLERTNGQLTGDAALERAPGERDVSGRMGMVRAQPPRAFLKRPELLNPVFDPKAPRRILPGTAVSVDRSEPADPDEYFVYSPSRPPLNVRRADRQAGWMILEGEGLPVTSRERAARIGRLGSWQDTSCLVWGDRVYEPIGGGVVLVKEYQEGRGIDAVVPHIYDRR